MHADSANYRSSRCDHIRRIGEDAATNRRSPSTRHNRYHSVWPRDLCPLSLISCSPPIVICSAGLEPKQRLYEHVPTDKLCTSSTHGVPMIDRYSDQAANERTFLAWL